MKTSDNAITKLVLIHERSRKICIGQEAPDPWYEKAFFSGDFDTDCDFSRNTTTWD